MFVLVGVLKSTGNVTIDQKMKKKPKRKPIPQIVFHIHYHKTGYAITHQYKKAVKFLGRRNAETLIDGVEGNSSLIITDQIVETTAKSSEKNLFGPSYYTRRAHDNITGCPWRSKSKSNQEYKKLKSIRAEYKKLKSESAKKKGRDKDRKRKHKKKRRDRDRDRDDQSWNSSNGEKDGDGDDDSRHLQERSPSSTDWNKTTSPSKIWLMYLPEPDFFCNLYENDVFLQRSNNNNNNNEESSDGPNHDIKFIHMLRDPFGTLCKCI